VAGLGVRLSIELFASGIRSFEGDEILTKPGDLPGGSKPGDLTDFARHLNNPGGRGWDIVTQMPHIPPGGPMCPAEIFLDTGINFD
jgi:hypothetical protein